jgi:hypothetical protein
MVMLKPLARLFPSLLQQVFDVSAHPRRLVRHMDIYDGGGNFSCGLEEGSTMRSTWAVDNFDDYESDACITPIWPILRIRCNFWFR